MDSDARPTITDQVAELERVAAAVRALAAKYGKASGDAFAGETIFADLQLALGPTHAVRSL